MDFSAQEKVQRHHHHSWIKAFLPTAEEWILFSSPKLMAPSWFLPQRRLLLLLQKMTRSDANCKASKQLFFTDLQTISVEESISGRKKKENSGVGGCVWISLILRIFYQIEEQETEEENLRRKNARRVWDWCAKMRLVNLMSHSRPIQKKGLMQIRCCWLYSFFYFIFAQPSRLEYDDFWKGQALYHLEQRQNFERRLDLEVCTKQWSFGFTLFFQAGAEEWGAGNKICMQNVYWY